MQKLRSLKGLKEERGRGRKRGRESKRDVPIVKVRVWLQKGGKGLKEQREFDRTGIMGKRDGCNEQYSPSEP